LLASGAAPLTEVGDVLRSFGLERTNAPAPDVSEPAGRVLTRLRDAPAGVDDLARVLELDASALAVALSELEVAGLVAEAAGIYRVVAGVTDPR
jgi:predicted Rossmann fold nucleotide-binding protein DprA/Smf involved in DNA uptake